MGTKYTTTSSTGYNSSPPADDGSAVPSNEITWATIKSKLPDPLKTFIEAINTKLVTHFDESVLDTAIARTTVAGDHKKTINVTAAATQSLGDAATMAVGYIVTIKNSHTAAITVDLATAGDTLDGTAAGSLSLEENESVTFITTAGADGYLKKDIQADDTSFPITLATEQASTSGTAIDFTGIPAGTKRITVMLIGVSLSLTDDIVIQLGDAGGFEVTGYATCSAQLSGAAQSSENNTDGFHLTVTGGGSTLHGSVVFELENSAAFQWAAHGIVGDSASANIFYVAGSKALSSELTQVRVTRDGSNTFDAGAINIQYES